MEHFQLSVSSLIFNWQPLLTIIFHVVFLKFPLLLMLIQTQAFISACCDYECNFWFSGFMAYNKWHYRTSLCKHPENPEWWESVPVTVCFNTENASGDMLVVSGFSDAVDGYHGFCTWHKVKRLRDKKHERGSHHDPRPAFVFASGEVWAAVGWCQHEDWNNYHSMLAYSTLFDCSCFLLPVKEF